MSIAHIYIYLIAEQHCIFCLFRNVQVLYDRPPDRFQPITSTVKYEILSKLLTEYEEYMIPERPANKFHIKNDSTVRVVKSIAEGGVQTQEVAIIISATSWTPDEDFNMLLEAFDGTILFIIFSIYNFYTSIMPFF